ncbi:hypothetical protein T492DRAFT_982205 [Pavlovales sp. CCMP2436]|nr:hypothetical protein T492DRAFT_982205 [Pavlovales sp. CCMP2436]|mmetsp:Transcript_33823/g.79596  ORF Transcript_33823/g.79596 Transcript_33823/m.79596 type:complete len:252 (+) Transcript_33823:518-1273(+)
MVWYSPASSGLISRVSSASGKGRPQATRSACHSASPPSMGLFTPPVPAREVQRSAARAAGASRMQPRPCTRLRLVLPSTRISPTTTQRSVAGSASTERPSAAAVASAARAPSSSKTADAPSGSSAQRTLSSGKMTFSSAAATRLPRLGEARSTSSSTDCTSTAVSRSTVRPWLSRTHASSTAPAGAPTKLLVVWLCRKRRRSTPLSRITRQCERSRMTAPLPSARSSCGSMSAVSAGANRSAAGAVSSPSA